MIEYSDEKNPWPDCMKDEDCEYGDRIAGCSLNGKCPYTIFKAGYEQALKDVREERLEELGVTEQDIHETQWPKHPDER